MRSFYLCLGVLLGVHQLSPQTVGDLHASVVKDNNATNAPLFLSITGEGRVVPFHDGEMLQVGRKYIMAAIPDRDYVFTNWTEVQVFILITSVTNNGETFPTTNTVEVPLVFTNNPVLRFTQQSVNVLFSSPDSSLTESTEWRANFVPGRRPGSDRGWWPRR
jgi:hypothetical protein